MNLIKRHILKMSLYYYGIHCVRFDNEYIEDVFGNLKLYSLTDKWVVIHTGSIRDVYYEDFDTFVGELCYCIYNSVSKGYYDPTFIINKRRELYGKERKTTINERNVIQISEYSIR